jgi:hypothetical protein
MDNRQALSFVFCFEHSDILPVLLYIKNGMQQHRSCMDFYEIGFFSKIYLHGLCEKK